MKSLSVTINKERWAVRLLNDIAFIEKHGAGYSGMTTYNHGKGIRSIDFAYGELSKSTVVHEVTHAYLSYFDFSKMSYGAIEEKFADLLGAKAHFILRVSDTIYRGLK